MSNNIAIRTFRVEVYTVAKGREVHTGTLIITRRGSSACIKGSKRALAVANAMFNLPKITPKKEEVQ